MTRPRFAAAVLAVGLVVGCSSRSDERTEVTGKVTRSGAAVCAGLVTFHGPNGRQATGAIRPNGEYTVSDPPVGVCQITVKAVPESPAAKSGRAAHGHEGHGHEGHGPPIPPKYENPGNGLSHDVRPGAQTRDLELAP